MGLLSNVCKAADTVGQSVHAKAIALFPYSRRSVLLVESFRDLNTTPQRGSVLFTGGNFYLETSAYGHFGNKISSFQQTSLGLLPRGLVGKNLSRLPAFLTWIVVAVVNPLLSD